MAAPSLPATFHPPVVEQTPVREEGNSEERASSPKDLLKAYVVQEPHQVLAQVGPIVEQVCCPLLLNSF